MNVRRIVASLVAGIALATGLTVGGGSPAMAAAPGCDGGYRGSARFWASTGDFITPTQRAWTVGTSYNKVALRFHEGSQCAWGLYNGGRKASVYLEYKERGSLYRVDRQAGSKSAYTGVWPDQEPRVMRACAADAGRIYCTAWY